MTRISIDNEVSDSPSVCPKTLGQLLPKRPPTLFEEPLIPATPPNLALWGMTGLDIAISCIEMVQRSFVRAAELFREHEASDANRHFIRCVDGLERFVEAVTISRSAMKLDFGKVMIDGIPFPQIEAEFSEILKGIVALQEKHDFIGVADKVEYELLTNLRSWANALQQIQRTQISNT